MQHKSRLHGIDRQHGNVDVPYDTAVRRAGRINKLRLVMCDHINLGTIREFRFL